MVNFRKSVTNQARASIQQLKPMRNSPLLHKHQQQRLRLLIERLDPGEPLITRTK